MTTKMLTVRITAEQQQRWTAAANLAGVMLSDWVRRTCDWGHDEQIGKAKVAGTREPGSESEVVPTSRTVEEGLKRGLPRSTAVRRKHINLREDADEEKPGKKVRCTYLWPSNSKKCPRCHEVHTDV